MSEQASAHTPGPWIAVNGEIRRLVGRIPSVRIAIVETGYLVSEGNASLIAAAPDLVAALRDAVHECRDCDGHGVVYTMVDETQIGQPPGSSGRPCPTCADWRSALAKAEGK